ncbi:MAG: DegT/DnrJ/EryC1/StrS aminotransferase family protein [Bacteroidales bacterium]|nr:DegT/DnrJ/EryC1/StrS aminotransferase family protein [Bacteroidales bacterium]
MSHIKKQPEIIIPTNLLSFKRNYFFKNTYPLFQGRYAFHKALNCLNIKSNDEVLLPSYHCLSMVEPVLCYGCKINFYRIRKDLITTVEDIKDKITDETKVIFIVHYFGLFQKETKKIKDFLTSKNIFCIEDCAHIVPFIDDKAGSIGDISIFSPRKFLPIIDGAFLRINNSEISMPNKLKKLSLLKELKIIKNAFEQQLNNSRCNCIRNCYFSIYKKLNKAFSISTDIQMEAKESEKRNSFVEFDMNLLNAQYSIFSSILLKYSDFKGIYRKRIQAFKFLYSEIYDNIDIKPPEFITSEKSTCVLGFPILINNKKDFIRELKIKKISHFTFGEKLYQHLCKKNYIMPDDQLSNQLLFIPMHEDLDDKKLRYIAQNIKQILFKMRY